MTGARNGSVLREIDRLFNSGTCTGLTEGQILRRFVASRDEAAFEALLALHGPMVLGVCRRLLPDPHDAEDAFQATFLVFVRKAGSIRPGKPLAPWLHGVARRVAARVKAEADRHGVRKSFSAEAVASAAAREPAPAELHWLLDEEIGRLPEKYRLPMVLCYLEGRTHEEAARQLHCPVGTINSRLARAREKLRERLIRRGLARSVLPFGASPFSLPEWVAPSWGWADASVRSAVRLATCGPVAAEALSARVFVLTKGVLQAMFLTKLKAAAAVVVVGGALTAGVGVRAYQGPGGATAGASAVEGGLSLSPGGGGLPQDTDPATPSANSAGRLDPITQATPLPSPTFDPSDRDSVTLEAYRRYSQQLAEVEIKRIGAEARLNLLRNERIASRSPDPKEIEEAVAEAFYSDPRVVGLLREQHSAEMKLKHAKTLSANPHDPSVTHAQERFDEAKQKLDALWAQREPRIRKQVLADSSDKEAEKEIERAQLELESLLAQERAYQDKLNAMKVRDRTEARETRAVGSRQARPQSPPGILGPVPAIPPAGTSGPNPVRDADLTRELSDQERSLQQEIKHLVAERQEKEARLQLIQSQLGRLGQALRGVDPTREKAASGADSPSTQLTPRPPPPQSTSDQEHRLSSLEQKVDKVLDSLKDIEKLRGALEKLTRETDTAPSRNQSPSPRIPNPR